ncbi:MAG: SDR family NAD(P)-dependent oxidoreductase [Candidatus Methanofastidiosa archaeon]|nr:SDR family NAD(P)-dependent oxidoreductase [Candidatus Methanofastidiosa archaeon]
MKDFSKNSSKNLSWIYPSISILVPAFNEEKNLQGTLERIIKALNVTVEDFEIIICNDGSTDNTRIVADQLAKDHEFVKVIHNSTNMGLGYCYQLGIEIAEKQLFIYIPGDNTWPYRSLLELFGNIGKADIITSYSSNPQVRTRVRRIVSKGYTNVLNILSGYRMHYYNGLTIYPTDFLKKISIKTTGFGFQAETLLRALTAGYSVTEVALPIDERTSGKSKAVNIKNIISVVQTIFRILNFLHFQKRTSNPKNHSKIRNESKKVVPVSSTVLVEEQGLGFSNEQDSNTNRDIPSNKKQLRVVITGASSGIGSALLDALTSDGHIVFACARRENLLNSLTRDKENAFGWQCDVSDEQQVQNFIAEIEKKTPYIDAVINCAGSFGAIGPLKLTRSEEWLNTLQVNLYGTYLMCKYTIPLLSDSSSPQIINLAGGGAFSPFPNYSAYAISKTGVVRLTECLAMELASDGIMVNAIAPGFVITNIHDSTLEAGEKLAGKLQYHRTREMIENGGVPLSNVINCIRYLLLGELFGLTGKTISANFDPWQSDAFKDNIRDITRSDLYSLRRVNLVNLQDGTLKKQLDKKWSNYGTTL